LVSASGADGSGAASENRDLGGRPPPRRGSALGRSMFWRGAGLSEFNHATNSDSRSPTRFADTLRKRGARPASSSRLQVALSSPERISISGSITMRSRGRTAGLLSGAASEANKPNCWVLIALSLPQQRDGARGGFEFLPNLSISRRNRDAVNATRPEFCATPEHGGRSYFVLLCNPLKRRENLQVKGNLMRFSDFGCF
jgi:hypothetical protein